MYMHRKTGITYIIEEIINYIVAHEIALFEKDQRSENFANFIP